MTKFRRGQDEIANLQMVQRVVGVVSYGQISGVFLRGRSGVERCKAIGDDSNGSRKNG